MEQINLNNNNKPKLKLDKDTIKQLLLVDYKRITIMACVALILLLSFFVLGSHFKSSENAARDAYNKYQSNQMAQKTYKNVDHSNTKTVVVPSDSTVDVDKINADIKSAEKYMNTWFNWKDGNGYDKARKNVINTFGKDSSMGKMFVKNARLKSGRSYVDVFNINMSITNMQTYPIKIRDRGKGNNDYMSIMTISSTKDGYSTSYEVMMTYTYNKDSLITDAKAYFIDN